VTGEDSSLYSVGVKRQLSWMQGMVQEPAAFKNLTINLTVQAYINKASELDLTKPVILDGLKHHRVGVPIRYIFNSILVS
jgi:hypothetical protein